MGMNNNCKVLIVDDDQSVTASLALLLKQNKFFSVQAHSAKKALELLETEDFALVLQDMNFSRSTTGEEGIALLRAIKSIKPTLPVVLMTAWASITLAVEGMRLGAFDFVAKPWDNDHLIRTIQTIVGLTTDNESSGLSRLTLEEQYDFSHVVGESPAFLSVLSTVARVCRTDASVLIIGESGTGKEVIADAIHKNSHRKNAPLVKVNLGGISPSLFESEMFGHVKGAFTDAKYDREGRFAAADNGTLFLDEIGELDKSSQVKLLRVLQDQNFQMVGSSKNSRVNVRIVSATNQDLEALVKQDAFREDLFYRINLITIKLPALRERVSDIPLLARNHLQKVSELYGVGQASITPQAINWLQLQPWPGNIRQLCQTIERVLLMSGKQVLDVGDFCPTEQPDDIVSSSGQLGSDFSTLTIEDMEKIMIERAIAEHAANLSKVAVTLGISRSTLYRRIEKYGISVEHSD